jgi:glycosyltransferase involved in cell wall biosynthesis/ubiquinone/menaquinone biosynthesis C-methylase UbiE
VTDAHGARALILVRNTVSHDARILREAATLRDLGYDVLIAGVVSTTERETELEIAGTRVVRLDPPGALKRLVPGRRGRSAAPSGAAAPAPRTEPSAAARPSVRTTVRRLAITGAYYALGAALVRRERPRLVHANDYNTMWIGIAAKVLRGSRVVYDCHELWADRNGRPEWRPWLVASEFLFVRAADATITASPGYADELAARYRVPRPTVVRNIPAPLPGSEAAGGPVAPDPGLVVYVGGLMPGRGLEQAIRALALAPEKLRLRLVGPGSESYRASLSRLAAHAGVADRVELHDPVPPSELLTAIAGAGAGLMLIEPVGRSYELTLPNKLFEYAAAGAPILASDMPVLAGVVSAEGLGEVVPVDDVAQVAGAMQLLAEPAVNARVRERVRAFAARETWEREQAVLADVYEGHERDRVERTYAHYAASPRKRRTWDAGNAGNAAIRDELVDTVFAVAGLELRSARRVLDIGCGSGWWLERLAAHPDIDAELYGVELQPERVRSASERVPGAVLVEGDARRLPFEGGRFEVVSLFTVLSSLADRADAVLALHEARRVLAPGGVLLVWEPRLPNPLNRSTQLVTKRLVRDALADAEIAVRTTTVLPALARRLGPRTDRLYPHLAAIPAFRSHRLIHARALPGGATITA